MDYWIVRIKTLIEVDKKTIIPSNWVRDNGKTCIWPDVYDDDKEKQTKAIYQKVEPQDWWEMCQITKVYSTAENYDEAKEKYRISLKDSDVENQYNNLQNKKLRHDRHRTQYRDFELDASKTRLRNKSDGGKIMDEPEGEPEVLNSEESNQVSNLKGTNTATKGQLKSYDEPPENYTEFQPGDSTGNQDVLQDNYPRSPKLPKSLQSEIVTKSSLKLPAPVKPTGPTVKANETVRWKITKSPAVASSSNSGVHRDEKELLLETNELCRQILRNQAEAKVLIEQGNYTGERREVPDEGYKRDLPLKTLLEFLNFNKELIDVEGAIGKFDDYIGSIGGGNGHETTRNMLAAVLTDPVAIQFSFVGKRGKHKFKPSKIWERILLQVQCTRYKKTEAEDTCSKWLKQAKKRMADEARKIENEKKLEEQIRADSHEEIVQSNAGGSKRRRQIHESDDENDGDASGESDASSSPSKRAKKPDEA